MKKTTIAVLTGFLLLSIFGLGCKKATEDVTVLKAPAETIIFTNVSDFILDSTGKTIHIQAKISSQYGLQKVELIYQPWNLSKAIAASGNELIVNEPVTIPTNAALQIHSITLKATDTKGATNFTEIKVGLQDLNYNKIYLTDAMDNAALGGNLYGVPVAMNKLASHTFQVIYYAKTAGTKVRFIPNKASLSPVAVGIDPNTAGKLITDASRSLPIILSKTGYYKITINTLLLNYTVENYSPVGTAPNQVAFVGRGFYDYPNMNWQNALPDIILMDKDPVNPFLFIKKLKLGIPAGASYNTAQFILTTNNGWTDFWRFNDGSSPEYAVFNGGVNTDLPITSTASTYLFVFDAQTNLVQAIKQ
jgi:hypothetical protein